MRNTVLLVLLLAWAAGCADDSYAGSAGAAGDSGSAGTTGSAGTGDDGAAGAAGAIGAGGQGGAASRPTSCALLVGDVSGTDAAASWAACSGQQTIRAIVTDGAADVFGAWPTVGSFTIWPHSGGTVGDPTTDGQCNVDIRYDRPPPACSTAACAGCTKESLFVHLVVPAI